MHRNAACRQARALGASLAVTFAFLVSHTALSPARAQSARANPDFVLNEVLADPARDWDGDGEVSASNDEWVEVYNRGGAAVSLEGFRLGSIDREWAYGFSGSLSAGERLTVFGSTSKTWQQEHGESAFGLRLANAGDTIVLWQIAGADTILVDAYTYQSHEADDDRSSGRRPDGGEVWELYDALNPYTGSTPPLGNDCAPTPGTSNNCVTPVAPETWGGIKARHRDR